MMYYLMTECKLYQFEGKHPQKSNHFIYIDKITKGNETVYDINDYSDKLDNLSDSHSSLFRRKVQMQRLAELISKEKGLQIIFNGKTTNFQIISFTSDTKWIIFFSHKQFERKKKKFERNNLYLLRHFVL